MTDDIKTQLITRHASRKWIAFLLVAGAATALLIAGLVGEATWQQTVGLAAGIFTGGNVWQKHIEKRNPETRQ